MYRLHKRPFQILSQDQNFSFNLQNPYGSLTQAPRLSFLRKNTKLAKDMRFSGSIIFASHINILISNFEFLSNNFFTSYNIKINLDFALSIKI